MRNGIPRKFPAPNRGNPVFPRAGLPIRFGKVFPLDLSKAKPRATYIVPRVAMKGATLNRVISKPLMSPISTPRDKEMKMTTGTLKYIVTPKISRMRPS